MKLELVEEDLYIVTAKLKNTGRQTTISVPMNKSDANKLKKKIEAEMRKAIDKYKWAENIKIETIK